MICLHASCASWGDQGALLCGRPQSGKSDLLLRLLGRGLDLVGDDQIELDDRIIRPVARLQGMIEVAGIGILMMPYRPAARLALVVNLTRGDRMPAIPDLATVPIIQVDPAEASAPDKVLVALRCVSGEFTIVSNEPN